MHRRFPALVIGLGMFFGLVVVPAARAVPFYTVQNLGPMPTTIDGPGVLVNGQGKVTYPALDGLDFGNAATGPVPAGDQRYYSVSEPSNNGLDTVGRAWNPTAGHMDGYIVSGGQATALPPVDASVPNSTIAPYAVNNLGQVVGGSSWINPAGQMISGPSIFTPGTGSRMIATNGGNAYGINDLGQVVGSYIPTPAQANNHAFFWNGSGGLIDLNSAIPAGSGLTLTSALSINDSGQIGAYGVDASGKAYALLLTPAGAPPTSGGGDPGNSSSGGSNSGTGTGPTPSGPPSAGSAPSGPLPTPAPEPSTLAIAAFLIGALALRARTR